MAKDEEEDDLLPDKDAAKGFYAKYEPKEILGRGISSTVRRCIEKETGKEFAAKIIDLGAATEAGDTNPHHMLEATRQEISILRQVMGHPYIIDLQDVFESDAFVFLVFELCPKGELFDYLTSVVTLSEKKTRTIMRQIFEGVEFIHAKSIVHRDLKPENILLDENHNVKITDFGFARQLKIGEKLMDLCGTPGYLAPETLKCNMFEGSPGYSQEVDMWACGVIMFTLLVGCPPFWHRKQMVMLRNIMEGKYSFTSPEWADISEDPKDLIRKCLVVDPSQRITVQEALSHPFFNQMLFEQNIDGLKRSLSTKSRRMSRITEIAMVLLPEPSLDGRTTTYQLKSQSVVRNGISPNSNMNMNMNASCNANAANIANTNSNSNYSIKMYFNKVISNCRLTQPAAINNNNNQNHNNINNNNKNDNNNRLTPSPSRDFDCSGEGQMNSIVNYRTKGSNSGMISLQRHYEQEQRQSQHHHHHHVQQQQPRQQSQEQSQQQHQQQEQQEQFKHHHVSNHHNNRNHHQTNNNHNNNNDHHLHLHNNDQQYYDNYKNYPIPADKLSTTTYSYSQQMRKQSRFNARKKFQFAILVIRAVIRIRRLRYTAEPLHVEEAIRDPYRVKVLRKVIDGCAFRVYGHWVKKGEGQNRAALFENTPRTELHALYINNLSR